VIECFPVKVALTMRRSTMSAFLFLKGLSSGYVAKFVGNDWMSKFKCCSGNRCSTEKHQASQLESHIEVILSELCPL
jgi:hypothetical protein